MNKDEILDALEDSREAFLDLLDAIPEDAWEQPGVMDDWSIKDILYHLTMAEAEVVKILWLIDQNLPPAPAMLDAITEDAQNAEWKNQGQLRSIDQVLIDYQGVRKQTSRRLLPIPDKALEDPQYYPSLKNLPLWQWIASSTFQHEMEHAESVQAWIKINGWDKT